MLIKFTLRTYNEENLTAIANLHSLKKGKS